MYRVNEIFYSLQGEGAFTGTPMIFVRFSGCNCACTFCDTDFASFRNMTVDEIVKAVSEFPSKRIVLTGGEPLLQVDDQLISALHKAGFTLHIETNGTLTAPPDLDWITCSPKTNSCNLPPEKVNEVKIVFTGQSVDELEKFRLKFPHAKFYYLQPCSGLNIAETVEMVKRLPQWRLSLQTHKLIDIP